MVIAEVRIAVYRDVVTFSREEFINILVVFSVGSRELYYFFEYLGRF